MTPPTTIQPYEDLSASRQEPDPRNAAVAARLAGLIRAEYPEAAVHHIGSTSVPELAGKGVIDLALEYPPGGLEQARGALERLGFQRQEGEHAFPESRPMRTGAISHEGRHYRIHVHVIQRGDTELSGLLAFRDALRADAGLRAAYVRAKDAILQQGITDPLAYCLRKGEFIEAFLARHEGTS